MAASESGGVRLRITTRSRHLEQMNAVKAQREPAGRYVKLQDGAGPTEDTLEILVK